jgi:hypothetical protein
VNELSDLDRDILAFEHRHWHSPAGVKTHAINSQFGWSTTRYHQRLVLLLDCPAAEQDSPQLIHRLQRLRVSRARTSREPY